MIQVRADRLKEWFQMVSDVAEAIDEHLTANFIGSYEFLELFHWWRAGPRRAADAVGVKVVSHRLQEDGFHALVGGRWPGMARWLDKEYTRELRRYYLSL